MGTSDQLYLWEFTIIGLGSFFIALEPNSDLIKPGFISLIIKKALPGAIMIIVSAVTIYSLYLFEEYNVFYTGVFSSEQYKAMLFIMFSILPLVHFYIVCQPFSKIRLIVFIGACVVNILLLSATFLLQTFDPSGQITSLITSLFGISFHSLITTNYLEVGVIVFVAAFVFLLVLFIVNSFVQFFKTKGETKND